MQLIEQDKKTRSDLYGKEKEATRRIQNKNTEEIIHRLPDTIRSVNIDLNDYELDRIMKTCLDCANRDNMKTIIINENNAKKTCSDMRKKLIAKFKEDADNGTKKK